MPKSKDAFRTISEVAEWLDTQPHVLRFWESKFTQVRPVKRAGGRRYYRPADMVLLGGIKSLLHDDGMTIKGVQKLLREKGIKEISALSRALDDDLDTAIDMDAGSVEAPVAEVVDHPAVQTPTEVDASPVEDAVIAEAPPEEPAAEVEDPAPVVEDQVVEDQVAGQLDAPAMAAEPARKVPKKPLIEEADAWETRRRLLARLTEIDHVPSDQLANVAQSLAQLSALQAKSKEAHAS